VIGKLLSGSVTQYLVYAIAALVALVALLGWLLRSEIRSTGAMKQERSQLQQSLHDQARQLREAVLEQERTGQLLAERARQRNAAQQTTAALKRTINEMEEQADEAYRSCLDLRLPGPVLDELRGPGADRGATAAAAARSSGADAGTDAAGGYLPGPADVVY
jgi:hypothetical protein